jgi:hypothetical protein
LNTIDSVDFVYCTRRMAMGKRRRRMRQPSMWVATHDLPRSASHPFYTRLNHVLDQADFDGYVAHPFFAVSQSNGTFGITASRPASGVTRNRAAFKPDTADELIRLKNGGLYRDDP